MQNIRRQHSSKFKAQVALEALLENKTIAEIASFYKIHPTQIHKWKKCLKANMSEIFLDKRTKEKQDKEDLIYHVPCHQLYVVLKLVLQNMPNQTTIAIFNGKNLFTTTLFVPKNLYIIFKNTFKTIHPNGIWIIITFRREQF